MLERIEYILPESWVMLQTRTYSAKEFSKRAGRLRNQAEQAGIAARQSGLMHPIYGHMNKHLLRMRYSHA